MFDPDEDDEAPQEAPAVNEAPTVDRLYNHGAITRDWAQRVHEHQVALIASIRHRAAHPPVERAPGAEHPLPWTLEDLRHHPTATHQYSTKYRGVVKTRYQSDYFAYCPPTPTTARRPLGRYRTELEAAYAVLYALNPLTRNNPNGATNA